MSRCLTDRGIEHVAMERGRLAERWRSERWGSLRLLTPNWQSRLPGFRYQGSDPEGFMTMPEVVSYLQTYARSFVAPVEEGTTVLSVARSDSDYRVDTDRGAWRAENVVIATGYCDHPFVPPLVSGLSRDVCQLVPTRYQNPGLLPEGGVLVVGASASGVQIADELLESGRSVTLAVGRHTRLPRRYRGRDILWWFDALGIFDENAHEVKDRSASRQQPSLQLAGRNDRSVDLMSLEARGVRLTGRATGASGSTVFFADDLVSYTAAADVKLARLLHRIDEYIVDAGLESEVSEEEPFVPFVWPKPAPMEIDLRSERITTVLWATGFRRRYPWLHVPVLDERGEIRHEGGITEAAGLYVLGLPFLRRRKSSFLDGVGQDALELSEHIAARRIRGTAVA
jgi:putative flavoprotein involved in K+ transport